MRTVLVMCALVLVGVAIGCDRVSETPPPEKQRRILEGQPEVFVEAQSSVALEGMDEIYLGQSSEKALEALRELCPETMEYRLQQSVEKAWFRGCEFERPKGAFHSVRVGFWPSIGERVATLEVKRDDVGLPVVRERFRDLAGGVRKDVVRSGYLEMRAERYQLLADQDEGAAGPTHITLGYTRSWAESMQK